MERRTSLFWPLALIAAGMLWILIQLGKIDVSNLWALTYLWPFLLICAGIGLILRPYWRWAGLMTSLLAVGGLFLGVFFAAPLGWNSVPTGIVDGAWFLGASSERGSGRVISQSREIHDITAIRVAYPVTVDIRQGPVETLTLEGEDNVLAEIQTRVADHVLEIDNGQSHKGIIRATRPVHIAITLKDLSQVDLDSAGEIDIQGLTADTLRANLDGAGTLNLASLRVGSLEADLSGVGSVHASGVAKNLIVRVQGVGSFEGAGLHAQNASVTLDGLGSADVWVDDQLRAIVNGLGSVNYQGTARVDKTVNGLGSVQPKRAK